jgi:sugar/nucleoside kinase (ribokinase family)
VRLDLVDTRGAGDSFTPGLLDGLHRADLVGGARRHALAAIDEDAFRALSGKRIGISVGRADDPEVGGRDTSAVFVLDSVEEVERFLDTLAR